MPVNSFESYPMSWRPVRTALGPGPLYLALAAALEHDVRTGVLPPGTRLPPQRELADFLDIDFTTVTRAYGVCRAKGLVYGVTGRGTFVSAVPGITESADDDGLIDLGVVQSFPEVGAAAVVAAAQKVLSRETARRLFSYGDRDGLMRHRAAGRQWLARCGVDAPEDCIAVFPGVQGAISTALLSVFGVGDAIAVDAFTYANLLAFARLAGVRLVPVEGDAHGMNPEKLDEVAVRHGVRGAFLMPNCANPTTLTMTERRKDELAEVASRRRLVVLEDDASLSQPSQRRKTLFSRLPESTVYLSGTTRLLAPGLRATYVCAPESVRDRFLAGLHHAAIKASPLDAEILGELVLSGEAESILSAKAIKAAKADRLFDGIFGCECAGDGEPRLFRIVPLPGTSGRGQEIERQCRAAGVRVFHSDRFAVVRGAKDAFLRVSVSSAGGMSRLRRGLDALRDGICLQLKPESLTRRRVYRGFW
ncbi:MAG: PLP-dependent aminotransferase family protein [Verrucomicrobiota bacterium]|nr:PLP-dependent aminotransferase family protein [Verrucomicrobiota bacterium]